MLPPVACLVVESECAVVLTQEADPPSQDWRKSQSMPRRSARTLLLWPCRRFSCYAHADWVQKDEILKHLGSLNYRVDLIPWSDDEIQVGDDYREQIEAALAAASVAILLVSVDALASRFIKLHELPRILQRRREDGMLLIPVLVRPCAWKRIDWLEALQLENARPLSELTQPEREQRCVELAERVHLAIQRRDRPAPTRAEEATARDTPDSGASRHHDPFHVDREEEFQAFLSLFDPSTSDHVMVVDGRKAMGKTTFLAKCLALMPAGSVPATVDFKELGSSVPEIIGRIATSFDPGGRFPNTFRRLDELSRSPAPQTPNVAGGGSSNLGEALLTKTLVDEARVTRMPGSYDLIVIDSLEWATQSARAWVSHILIGSAIKDHGLVVIVAGHDIADVGRSHPAGVVYRRLSLVGSRRCCGLGSGVRAEPLARQGSRISRVHQRQSTGPRDGIREPKSRTFQCRRRRSAAMTTSRNGAGPLEDFVLGIIRTYPPSLRRAVEIAAVTRVFSRDLLQTLFAAHAAAADDADVLWNELVVLPFVERRPHATFALHETTRQPLLADLKGRDRDLVSAVASSAFDYFIPRANSGDGQWSDILDAVYYRLLMDTESAIEEVDAFLDGPMVSDYPARRSAVIALAIELVEVGLLEGEAPRWTRAWQLEGRRQRSGGQGGSDRQIRARSRRSAIRRP